MNKEDLIARVDHLIAKGYEALATKHNTRSFTAVVDTDKYVGFRSAGLSLINQLFGTSHSYYSEFDKTLNKTYYASEVNSGVEILKAIKLEIEEGWLTSIRKLVTADVFSDFLEMAEHLLKEGYKDAAAVIAGSVLEDSLRKLAVINGVSVRSEKGKPLTIEPINVELAKLEVYNQLVKKQVTAWADLRNNAAHGNFGKYDEAQVKRMIEYITDFSASYLM
jgi:hypothetical protein